MSRHLFTNKEKERMKFEEIINMEPSIKRLFIEEALRQKKQNKRFCYDSISKKVNYDLNCIKDTCDIVIKIQIIDMSNLSFHCPLKIPVNTTNNNWYKKLCDTLHTKNVFVKGGCSINDMNKMNVGNCELCFCKSTLPKNWKLPLRYCFNSHSWENTWNDLMHDSIVDGFSNHISCMDHNDFKKCVNGKKSIDFLNIIKEKLLKRDVYCKMNSNFEKKEHCFKSFCKIVLGLEDKEDRVTMFECIKKFYIDLIPLVLIMNQEFYEMYLAFYISQKMLTKEQKLFFWNTALKNFYKIKFNSNKLSRLNKHTDINIHKLMQLYKESINFIKQDKYKNSCDHDVYMACLKGNDNVYKTVLIPFGMSQYLGSNNTKDIKQKFTLRSCYGTGEIDPLIKDNVKNASYSRVCIHPKEGYNDDDHLILKYDWDNENNVFNLNSKKKKYTLNPFNNELCCNGVKHCVDEISEKNLNCFVIN